VEIGDFYIAVLRVPFPKLYPMMARARENEPARILAAREQWLLYPIWNHLKIHNPQTGLFIVCPGNFCTTEENTEYRMICDIGSAHKIVNANLAFWSYDEVKITIIPELNRDLCYHNQEVFITIQNQT
jgi:hypothetical protein